MELLNSHWALISKGKNNLKQHVRQMKMGLDSLV